MTQPIHRFNNDPLQELQLWNQIGKFLEQKDRGAALLAVCRIEPDSIRWLRSVDKEGAAFQVAIERDSLLTVKQIFPYSKIKHAWIASAKSQEMLRLLYVIQPQLAHTTKYLAAAINLSDTKLLRRTAPLVLEQIVATCDPLKSEVFRRQVLYACIMHGDEKVVQAIRLAVDRKVVQSDSSMLLIGAVLTTSHPRALEIFEILLSSHLYSSQQERVKLREMVKRFPDSPNQSQALERVDLFLKNRQNLTL